MEYVYAAMLLHSAGKKIDESAVSAVLKAAGADVNDARVKALVASLEGVNIEEAIAKSVVTAAPVAAAAAGGAAPAKEEKKKEDDKKGEEEAASGLASLFG